MEIRISLDRQTHTQGRYVAALCGMTFPQLYGLILAKGIREITGEGKASPSEIKNKVQELDNKEI